MKSPYFPFFVRDWLCSRSVMKMSGKAVKSYVYLLAESWLSEPRATLPNDDTELAMLSRMSIEEFMSIKDEVLPQFKVGKCNEHKGLLYNETLLEISRKSESKSRKQNQNARKQNANKTQNERKMNAAPEYENETETENEIVQMFVE